MNGKPRLSAGLPVVRPLNTIDADRAAPGPVRNLDWGRKMTWRRSHKVLTVMAARKVTRRVHARRQANVACLGGKQNIDYLVRGIRSGYRLVVETCMAKDRNHRRRRMGELVRVVGDAFASGRDDRRRRRCADATRSRR